MGTVKQRSGYTQMASGSWTTTAITCGMVVWLTSRWAGAGKALRLLWATGTETGGRKSASTPADIGTSTTTAHTCGRTLRLGRWGGRGQHRSWAIGMETGE